MACRKLSFTNLNNFEIVYNYVECDSRFIRNNEILKPNEVRTVYSFGLTSDINSFSSAQYRFITFLQNETFPLTPLPTRTQTPTPTPTQSSTPIITPTPSVTVSFSPTQTPNPSPTPTITPSEPTQFLLLYENDNIMTAENNNGIQYQH